ERREDVERQREALTAALPRTDALAQRVERASVRIGRALEVAVEQASSRVDTAEARVRTLSPLATLGRGYALVTRADGSVAVDAATLTAGERIALRLRDGARAAIVEGAP